MFISSNKNLWSRILFFSGALSGLYSTSGHAAQIVYNQNYDIQWNTTLQYTLSLRTHSVNSKVGSSSTFSNSDSAFNDGAPTSSRVDVLSGFDFNLHDEHKLGFRLSAEGWYDSVYNGTHNSLAYSNAVGTPVNQFTHGTRDQAGQNFKLLDAFVHGDGEIGDHPITIRAGQHTVIWGESLFFAGNGIAAGQAPVDILKALSKPQIQAKELFLPVPQISGSFGLTDTITAAAYYQLGFRPDFLPPAGDYFALSDFLGAGAQRLLLPASAQGAYAGFNGPAGVPGGYGFYQTQAREGTNWHGQYGAALLYNNPDTDIDAGLYYIRYDNKSPTVVTNALSPVVPNSGFNPFAAVGPANSPVLPNPAINAATGNAGSYTVINARDVEAYGTSLSTTVGTVNVAGEISGRTNMPLQTAATAPGVYAAGDTLHGQVSAIYTANPSKLWDSLAIAGEVAAQHLVTATSHSNYLASGYARTAVGTIFNISPTYYQVLPNFDVSPSIGMTYLFTNTSVIDPSFGDGHGGDVSIGVSTTYRTTWVGAVNFTHELGNATTNTYIDRDFISFSIQHSF